MKSLRKNMRSVFFLLYPKRNRFLFSVVFFIFCVKICLVLIERYGNPLKGNNVFILSNSYPGVVSSSYSFPDTPGIYIEGVDDE